MLRFFAVLLLASPLALANYQMGYNGGGMQEMQQMQLQREGGGGGFEQQQQLLQGGSTDQGQQGTSAGAAAGPPLSEEQLYAGVPYAQFATGYGDGKTGTVERIDEAPQQMPDIVEQAQGQDTANDLNFPDTNLNNRFDNTKEIHSYNTQRRITNRMDRNLRRYYKNLNVNSLYNTNIARIRHNKIFNQLNVQTQDIHRPFLKVAYSRQDTTNDLGVRDEAPVVENGASSSVLQPIVEPAQVQRVGYNDMALSPGVGLNAMPNARYTSEWGQR